MRKLNYLVSVLAVILLAVTSCKKDDPAAPVFAVNNEGITASNYSGGGTLGFMFSTDDGTTWENTVSDLQEGTVLLVKVNDGSDLTIADYSFDWSASNPAPSDASTAVASFTIGQEAASIKVTVFELVDVIASTPSGVYTGDGTLAYEFSTDNGSAWSATAPAKLDEGAKVQVRVTDGTNALTADNFEFTWSATTAPVDANAAVAEFTVGASDNDIELVVAVTEIEELVMVRRSNGRLYSVDKATGDTTHIGTITDDQGVAIAGLRALVYDPTTGKSFLGSTNQDDASFYSLNITTGVATLLATDPNNDTRDGISDLLMAADGNVIANIYSNIVYNSAITTLNSSTGAEGTHYAINNGTNDGFSPGGLLYGSTANELIIGGKNEIYFSDLTGTVSDTTVLTPTSNISENMYVMDLARDKKTGVVYSLINDYSNTEYLYLTTVDLSTGFVTEVKHLANGESADKKNWMHCLAFIPRHRLPSAK